MLRAIGSVVVGYVVAALLTMLLFTAAYLVIGVDRTFEPGTYTATPLWNGLAIVVSAVVATVAGAVCGLIARSRTPVRVLAALFVVLGVLSAAMNANKPDPGPRAGDVPVFDAATKAKQPSWFAFSVPFIGAVFVTLGGSLSTRKKP